jgi:TRAP-type C4-dicarboxylate transport system permease small subunit
MFRRVTPEGWIHLTSIIGFVLTFLVFLGAVLRAWRLRQDKAEHLSHLPLQSDQPAPDTHRHE